MARKTKSTRQPAKPPKPAAKASVPAKTPKAMLAVADERFKQDANELRNRRRTMAGDLLQYRYDIGKMAIRIADEKQKATHERYYGSHTVQDTAEGLEEALSTIYACMKFIKQISPKQLMDLKAKEWPWRAVSSLFTIDDPKARKQLQADFEKGKFKTSDDFRDAVKKTNKADRMAGVKTETRGRGGSGGQSASMIHSLNTVFSQAAKRVLPEAIEGVRNFIKGSQKMSPAAVDKIAAEIKESAGNVAAVKKMIQQYEKVVKDAGPIRAAPRTADEAQAGAQRNKEDVGLAHDDQRGSPRGYLDHRAEN